jgi:hypothetical protein
MVVPFSLALSGHKNDGFKENAYTRTTTPNKASLLFGEKEKREGRVSERYRSGEFGG